MLKFVNKQGKVVFVLRDEDDKPTVLTEEKEKELKELGVEVKSKTERIMPEGISQEDLKMILGEY